jgi:hypothetical protein
MARFRIFLAGACESSVVELPASTLAQVSALASERRFLPAELVDVVDHDGVCSNREALIPISRIQMILAECE